MRLQESEGAFPLTTLAGTDLAGAGALGNQTESKDTEGMGLWGLRLRKQVLSCYLAALTMD